jgi:hypothetical protein
MGGLSKMVNGVSNIATNDAKIRPQTRFGAEINADKQISLLFQQL